ncbi:tyrosine-protein kinase transforming protein ros [Capsaspora owczarzaki ATCC 30864]|uniref:TKL protein kinase n=1 Tax=Capsaspora owczarzaki (strain ATCC 30864) TaxID=595528 RepID=A0A0D2VV65_CAPO3|nr:tyrosine-protein kinase transforming protein ros [Capsaspora owczarzaki ATCC 30864]KJE95342.1 TKL protein kinase [Capsaspora owczarzaki ATCC 30864]|eukprot:XP_004345386.1 tyrosine-protein kinase transforming protein ros [Capsaspora owczarzaki ATCC 30864]
MAMMARTEADAAKTGATAMTSNSGERAVRRVQFPATSSCAVFILVAVLTIADSAFAGTWNSTACKYTTTAGSSFTVSKFRRSQPWSIPGVSSTGGPDGYNYLYNFCPGLGKNIGSCVATDLVCQQSTTGGSTYVIGTNFMSTTDGHNTNTVEFKSTDASPRCTRVIFNCDPNTKGEPVTAATEQKPADLGCLATYTMAFTHACFCPGSTCDYNPDRADSIASVTSVAAVASMQSASAASFASIASTRSASVASIVSITSALSASVASTASASAASVASSIAQLSGGTQDSSPTAAIAAAVVSVTVIALLALIFIVMRRRRSQRSVMRPKDSAGPIHQEAVEMSVSPHTESTPPHNDAGSASAMAGQKQPKPKNSAGPIYQEADEVIVSYRNHSTGSHNEDDGSASAGVGQKQPQSSHQAISMPSSVVVYDDIGVYVAGSNSRRVREGLAVLKRLASGNFGDVSLGQVLFTALPPRAQTLLGPTASPTVLVAVKSLKSDADEKSRKDFEGEAKLMAPFVHPNVVRLLAALFESEPHLVLLEFVQYGDLRTLLQKSQAQSLWWTHSEQVHAIRQIALGMEYLGTLHFVHRDLAARNCLVGQGMVVKIADFGLSRELADEHDYYRMQTRGKLPLKWMAPETMTFRKFSSMSDVWSFGVTAWECCSYGAVPYGKMDGP